MRKLCVTGGVLVMLGAMSGGVVGQILPPAPGKTPATPEYVPPPPPPPPKPITPAEGTNPATAPAPDAPLPTLVERDEKGVLKALSMPAEEAAVRALKLNDETMQKVEASLGARRNDLDKVVYEHVESLADLRAFGARVNDNTPMDEFTAEAKKALAFKNFPGVLDRLSREGAIDPQTRTRAQRVAQEYTKAVDTDLMKDLNHGNTQSMVILGFRRYLLTTTTEANAALDRQLVAAAPKAGEILAGIDMPAAMKSGAAAKVRGLPAGDSAEGREKTVQAMREMFFDVLGREQRQAFLKAANPALTSAKAPAGAAPDTSK